MALTDTSYANPNAAATAGAASAVSWGAIFAGAAAAAALSLILLLLGTGLGLSSVSPWAASGVTATTFGVGTILWITFMQVAASGMGGYLAGRLRTRWLSVRSDEVYFRDTAHGFLAWAVATLVTAGVLTSAIGSIVGTGAQAGASVVGGMTGAATTAATAATAGGAAAAMADGGKSDSGEAGGGGVMGYVVDSLFRQGGTTAAPAAAAAAASAADAVSAAGAASAASAPAAAGASSTSAAASGGSTSGSTGGSAGAPGTSAGATTGEVTRIIANAVRTGSLSPEDSRYIGQAIAQRTGVSQADAEKRVTDAYAKLQTSLRDAQTAAKEAADKTRKASAYAALWLFVSLLSGAFVASLAATYGGRQRDA